MAWLVLLAATPALTFAGYHLRLPWLLPFLQVAPAFPILVHDLKARRRLLAILHMLAWALAIAVTMEALALHSPESGAASVLHGAAYRDEMVRWVRTGIGRESTPSQFIPEHLVHLTAFVVLAILSGGLLGLVMGAVMMNYMSFYVGSLMALAEQPGTVFFYGWPPWAILRVVGFVILGVILSGPALQRFAGMPFRWQDQRSLLLAAACALLLDLLLKTLLAPHWSATLRSALFPLSPGF